MTAITPDQQLLPVPKSRNFILFSIAQCISFSGDWMQKAAVGWLVWELTHSPAWVGAVALSDLIAAFWVAPLAGTVTDRSNPYRLIWLTQVLAMANSCVIWLLVVAGAVSPFLLLGWAIVDSTLQGFNQPARMMVTGALAPQGRISQAIAANSIAANIARSIGPMIGGFVMLHSGVGNVFLLNAISFIAIMAVLVHVRRWIDRPGLAVRSVRFSDDIISGFRYIRHAPQMAMLFALALSFSLLARPFTELFPALAGGTFKGGPDTLGLLMAAQGVGALLGAGWMLRKRAAGPLVRITYAAALGIAVSLIAFSTTGTFTVALALIGLAGLFHVVCNIGMQTMAQTMSDPAMRGRVLALYTLVFRAAPALGAFLIGFAAHWFDLQVLIGLAAAAMLLGILASIPAVRRIYFAER
ncbi:MFS transporter [Pararhizobium sp.]|uniref:MFS transporter n=1 Tax=Pararhizobium sp. TaxID=1977563 RepID=UPI003BABB1F2